MTTPTYKAAKTRSNRPGWSVTFGHPRRRDEQGKFGRKIRRGLGTTDDAEADRLVEQINVLLADDTWWSFDRRVDAERQFDSVVVSAFFDDIEVGEIDSRALRDQFIRMPPSEEGYARIMLVGTTGAGKTTLLRHMIGTDHDNDRFPSTSTAKTTIADTEIITSEGPFEAAVTFMPRHRVRANVEECLAEALRRAIQKQSDARVADALLSHRDQRFRLSYMLGSFQMEPPAQNLSFSFDDAADEDNLLDNTEAVADEERTRNHRLLSRYVANIKGIAVTADDELAATIGKLDDQSNNDQETWLELFDEVTKSAEFNSLVAEIVREVENRFDLITVGTFDRSTTNWPLLWHYKESDRNAFLKQVRWFSSNHEQQFGRLLTPVVNGVRVKGPFWPDDERLKVAGKLVLLDGEGLGHTAQSASSISGRITRQFQDVDLILLVDNAQQPMQAAPLELLKEASIRGCTGKLAIVFTHFDLVRGDNLSTFDQQCEHIRASVGNAIASLHDSLRAPSAAIMLERRLSASTFYLGGLDRNLSRIPSGIIEQMQQLMVLMQQSGELSGVAKRLEASIIAPRYKAEGLVMEIQDAAKEFKDPWLARLGLQSHKGISKQHWTRVKALSRRITNGWDNNEYDDLKPIANLSNQIQTAISRWLDDPADWKGTPESEEAKFAIINSIREAVSEQIDDLAERRLATLRRHDWQDAYSCSGPGSSFRRADRIATLLHTEVPNISSLMDARAQDFVDRLVKIVSEAVEEAGGSVEGIAKREFVNVS